MDSGTVRGLLTLAAFIAFIAIVFWAYSKRRKPDFDAMSRMPLEDDRPPKDGGKTKDQGSKTP